MPNQTIPLPTSTETRQRLEAAGFVPALLDLRFEYWDKNGHRYHLRHQGPVTVYQLRDAIADLPLVDVLEFASLVGISPTGYRLIPDEVAQAALPFVSAQAAKKREAMMFLRGGFPKSQEAWEKAKSEAEALEAISDALSSAREATAKEATP